ncbi:unnamed protein product [Sordaria macrospora k-hell]|uniref:WGS project CABT00000000 data, contig 2.4 n=2 Tax=Sordaria macrospora TaxID=5147 RepID=F7VQ78_SORMK|nr:uncharacterized protein SMAC_01228 [Sordaria macrospora k-hell]CCC07660.1 unnamed protein product [Sordaria macrospora k-hell]
MSLNRTVTQRAPGRGQSVHRAPTQKARKAKSYDNVSQGIKQLYPENASDDCNIDIVLVPGLGAHPEKSWESENEKSKFNWTTDKDGGIIKDFPKARVLLYMYESAWTGDYKVKQFMDNIARFLVISLNNLRKNCKTRPIVFIGHSMGGLVIAKAVALADRHRGEYPFMFEAISATIFFGTPFKGADIASAAVMFSRLAERTGFGAVASKLLEDLTPGNSYLKSIREEFATLITKLTHKIHVICFYEEQPTNFAEMAHLPRLANIVFPKEYKDFVTEESATLDGYEKLGLARHHRNLLKFNGPKDEIWSQVLRDKLKNAISGAYLTAKNRLNSARGLDLTALKGILDALDGASVHRKRRDLGRAVSGSTWITGIPEYAEWVNIIKTQVAEQEAPKSESLVDYLWVRGPEGRGKTGATLAVLSDIEALQEKRGNSGQDGILLAYFFCEPVADYSTAEDVLRSLLSQLINQQNALAAHASVFVKKNSKDKAQSQPTVDNLWQCLLNMLSDEFAGRRIYIVINNLHVLQPESESTTKLMHYLNAELSTYRLVKDEGEGYPVSTRWLLTSREFKTIEQALTTPRVRLVNLRDVKYVNQVQKDLQLHAKGKIKDLEKQKKYNKALAYYASSLIGRRATNMHWIDLTCVQLAELPETESHVKIRFILETTPKDLSDLLKDKWNEIFSSNGEAGERIKELLRTLLLTFEDPTEEELAVLAGLSRTEVQGLVEKCKPFLSVVKQTVTFMNAAVKKHLEDNKLQLLGMDQDEIEWQHGILALRSLTHLKEAFDFPERVDLAAENGTVADHVGEDGTHERDGEGNGVDGGDDQYPGSETQGEDNDPGEDAISEIGGMDDDDDDDDDSTTDFSDYDSEEWEEAGANLDPEADEIRDRALKYPVKHWLHHGSKSTPEFADDLSQDEEFWTTDSSIRRRWLTEYIRMTGKLEGWASKSLTALHVASSLGFSRLVVALWNNGHEHEMHTYDSLQNTPLHLAAYFGRTNTVEELLNRNAVIDLTQSRFEDTALHMAAGIGHVNVMDKLISRGANPNAYSEYTGLVINAAIASGNFKAVELLVQKGVLPTTQSWETQPPLEQAAEMTDISMLDCLIEQFKDKIPPEDYSKAMVAAARAGRLTAFNKLLGFEHSNEWFQKALDSAAAHGKWDIVPVILKSCRGLNCDEAFYQAAVSTENKDKSLGILWEYSDGTVSKEKLSQSLYEATDNQKLSTVTILLDTFAADPNATGEEYGNALTAAAYDGRLDILRLLLDADADVNSPDGWALQTAALEGHYDIVKELLNRGADVNAFTKSEKFPEGTALQAATEAGWKEIVSLLLEHNADPDLGGGPDAPPILAAAMYGNSEILDLLVDEKANVNVHGGEDNSTPLINAVEQIFGTDPLRKLLNAGADINATNQDGETALIVAAKEGDRSVVRFLLKNGADVMHFSNNGTNALKVALAEDQTSCLKVLINHVSKIMLALKSAMDSGNTEVAGVVRAAMAAPQGLSYDDGTKNPNQDSDEDSEDEDDEPEEDSDEEDQEEPTNGRVRFENETSNETDMAHSEHGGDDLKSNADSFEMTAEDSYEVHVHDRSDAQISRGFSRRVTWQAGDKRRESAGDGHHGQSEEAQPQQPQQQRPYDPDAAIVKLASAGRQMSEPTHPTFSSAEPNDQIPQAPTTPTFQRQQLPSTVAAPGLATVSENEQAQQAFQQWAAYNQALSSMAAQTENGQYMAYSDMSSYDGSSWGQQASAAGMVANYGNMYQAYAPPPHSHNPQNAPEVVSSTTLPQPQIPQQQQPQPQSQPGAYNPTVPTQVGPPIAGYIVYTNEGQSQYYQPYHVIRNQGSRPLLNTNSNSGSSLGGGGSSTTVSNSQVSVAGGLPRNSTPTSPPLRPAPPPGLQRQPRPQSSSFFKGIFNKSSTS